NGWHDFAVHDMPSDGHDPASSVLTLKTIDGGVGSVVVALHEDDAPANFIGGPQALLSPVGLGNGWGRIGKLTRRVHVRSMLYALLKAQDSAELSFQWRASALALTAQADEIVACVPDRPEFDEARQEFLLRALQRRGLSVRLLWHPVAVVLA